ncbi:FTR1 family protein [Neisseriaceae bacterium ESL0693]|nr:FTR1 family protein [Neisseriaceae bacterium ESL0693]
MGQTIFVVWRECFEALLVIGILYTWIRQHPDRKNGLLYLYGGVGAGVLASILLALIIYGVFNVLQGDSQTIFMIVMSALASVLIVQMVYWMRQHAQSMKLILQQEMAQSLQKHSWWGVLVIVAIAIAREGSEIVVFLSGQIMQLNQHNALPFLVGVLLGVVFSGLTFYGFILTSRLIKWQKFFTVTGVILLFLAASLLLKAVEDCTVLLLEHDEVIPDTLVNPAWDSSWLISENGLFGSLASSLFAYRAQPMIISVITFVVFWLVVGLLFRRQKKQ